MNNPNNNDNGHDMKMMWLMMLPCMLIPIIFLILSGKGLSAFNWQLVGGILFMVGIHVLMMKFMHGDGGKSCHGVEEKNKINEKE